MRDAVNHGGTEGDGGTEIRIFSEDNKGDGEAQRSSLSPPSLREKSDGFLRASVPLRASVVDECLTYRPPGGIGSSFAAHSPLLKSVNST